MVFFTVFSGNTETSGRPLPLHWKCRVLGNRDRGFESPSLRFEVARCGDLASFYADTFDKSAAQPSFKTDRSWAFDKNPARAHAGRRFVRAGYDESRAPAVTTN